MENKNVRIVMTTTINPRLIFLVVAQENLTAGSVCDRDVWLEQNKTNSTTVYDGTLLFDVDD